MRFPLYEAVSTYLNRAADGPLVVLLDDIHWADLPSLELLSYLTPSLATRPLLLVAAGGSSWRSRRASWRTKNGLPPVRS